MIITHRARYTVGQTHVVALSGEQGRLASMDTPEMAWLEADLAAAAAARARGELTFIVSHVHYPNVPAGYCSSMMGYCCANGKVGLRQELEGAETFAALNATTSSAASSSSHSQRPSSSSGSRHADADAAYASAPPADPLCVAQHMTAVNLAVEDMMVKYGVDVHITAHQHVYERTTPVYRYTAYGNGSEPFPAANDGSLFVSPRYPINVNNGCPGNVELQDVWMPRPPWSTGLRTNADGSGGTAPNNYADFGVLRMTMETGRPDGALSSLTMQYVDSRNGTVIDEFTILK